MLKHMLSSNSRGSPQMTSLSTNVVGLHSFEELNSGLDSSSPATTVVIGNGSPRSSRPLSYQGVVNLESGAFGHSNSSHPSHSSQSHPSHSSIPHSNTPSTNPNSSTHSSSVSHSNGNTKTTYMDSSRDASHDLNSTSLSPISCSASRVTPRNTTSVYNGNCSGAPSLKARFNETQVSKYLSTVSKDSGVKEMIVSLILLSLVSLLFALLSLVFLFKMTPISSQGSGDDVGSIVEVTLAMIASSLCLNLCCLLVCSIQFIFAVKLVKGTQGPIKMKKYLHEVALTRTAAIVGFFISIPLFLTGIILFTFLHFDSTSAIITAVLIGIGIIFCGAAVVHNVFIWQREKNSGNFAMTPSQIKQEVLRKSGKSFGGLPQATLDLSGPNSSLTSVKGLELSTLV